MREFQYDTELDESFEPVAGRGTDLLTRLLPYVVALALYLLFLNTGLWWAGPLAFSPVVRFTGFVLGFFGAAAGWLVAFLIFGLLGGHFSCANSVFAIIKLSAFRVSMVFLFSSVFPVRAFISILAKAGISYLKRKVLFLVSVFFILPGFFFLSENVRAVSDNPGVSERLYFLYILTGIIYLVSVIPRNNKQSRRRNRKKNKYKKQHDPLEELRRILKDL